MDTFGMDAGFARGMQFVIALAIVFALFALLVWGLRRLHGSPFKGHRARQPRLAVMDQTHVDTRRRLVLVRRDNVEHLLLIGGPTDVVVEQHIIRAKAVGAPPRAPYGTQPGTGAAVATAAAAGAAAVAASAGDAEEPVAEEAPEPEVVQPAAERTATAPLDTPEDTASLAAHGHEQSRAAERQNRMRLGAAPRAAKTALDEKIAERRQRRQEREAASTPRPAARETTARETRDVARVESARPSRGPAARAESRDNGAGDERRSLSSFMSAAAAAGAAAGAGATALGKRALAKTKENGKNAAEETAAAVEAAPIIEVSAPEVTTPEVSAPEPVAAETGPREPMVETPKEAAPEISVQPAAAKDAAADSGSLAGVTPASTRAPAEPAWLVELQQGLDEELSGEAEEPAASDDRVEPSFATTDTATDEAKDEAESSPADEPEAAEPKVDDDVESALAEAFDLTPDEPVSGDAPEATEDAGEETAEEAPVDAEEGSSEPAESDAEPATAEEERAPAGDEIEDEMAKLLSELTGKQD
ncbi:MAG: hypothetical protein C0606_12110 [Hyphomicrobiales bacterium]|nr:MAG: hypothetical protein C0606_12110 [Hyphomicrobiales bacterium]